ncbi:hypothetical protein [Shewanella algae]|uniref:hypothetical protein n=1 Tax=Shewanella algae TaxID=38313 RepID=UPI0034D3F263
MSRRYLSLSEAESALNRGKVIECFLGACERDGKQGIKWLSICSLGGGFEVSIYETADLGDESFLDLYGFGPLNPDLELEDPDRQEQFEDFQSLIQFLEKHFEGSSQRLVNQMVVQDEYSDFIARGRT